jgi:YaiO family outer membrane protein
MRKLYFLIALFICSLIQLYAQESQQTADPEEEFARMRELAVNGDYTGAKQIGYDLLETYETYHDVALYLARIHGWESNFDSAYMLLDRVMLMSPELYEAYSTCVDLAYWENNLEKLDECAARATEIEPDSAGAFDDYMLALQQSAPQPLQTQIFGIYSYDHFAQPYVRNWHMLTVGAEIPVKSTTLIPSVNAGYQASTNNNPSSDLQFNLDAYITIGRLNYALLAYGFSPDGEIDYFPGHRAAAELWQALPKGFGLSAGVRFFYWDEDFTFLTFSLEKYAGKFWFSFRNYLFFKEPGVTGSYYLTTRRYFDSRYDFISLTLGYGTAPDEPIDIVTDLERLNAASARFEFSKKVSQGIRLMGMVGYSYEEYFEQEYRNRYDFRLGAYFAIKK